MVSAFFLIPFPRCTEHQTGRGNVGALALCAWIIRFEPLAGGQPPIGKFPMSGRNLLRLEWAQNGSGQAVLFMVVREFIETADGSASFRKC